MKAAFYNEIDSYAAKWLRNLISAGELPEGIVDERSIEDIQPGELAGYTQVHFFAGIGGWAYALRLAGWPDDQPVWTGSCPCQPLSSAGQRKGHADKRHLWPAFHNLIAERRPATVFGEQVASKDGREWFSAVRADLERGGYACGCADLAAASVGAPHIRQRLFWVADAGSERRQQESRGSSRYEGSHGRQQDGGDVATSGGEDDRLANAMHTERRPLDEHREDGRDGTDSGRTEAHGEPGARGQVRGLGDASSQRSQERIGTGCVSEEADRSGAGQAAVMGGDDGGLADSEGTAPGAGDDLHAGQSNAGSRGGLGNAGHWRRPARTTWSQSQSEASIKPRSISPIENNWRDIELIPCADGKTRVTQPGLRPLAHGVPNRVGRLRAYGNAIVPQVAAEFIRAFMETSQEINEAGKPTRPES